MPRKRTYDEIAAQEPTTQSPDAGPLQKIRNLWEFAAFFEWLTLFGSVVKVHRIDIEDFERECIDPEPSKWLEETGLTILKFVSSRRDLTLDNWDETVRRQYEYKREGGTHPYGSDEAAANKFRDFHVFTKLRVLYQLAVWTFHNPDRIRSHFADMKEQDQFYEWQAHPVGWDRHSKSYFALSGNRLYRRTDPPIPVPKTKTKPKSTSKKAQAQRRRISKRRKTLDPDDADTEMGDADDTMLDAEAEVTTMEDTVVEVDDDPETINTFGEYQWECVATTLDDFNTFIASLSKKDPDEKQLKIFIEDEMLPQLEKQRERRERKEADRLREIQMAEKMVGAKRSGRLAAKQERDREDAEAAETARQKEALLIQARRDEEQQYKLENERRSRMQTREQRIREREYKRILLEEQLARDSENEKLMEEGNARGTRRLKERIQQQQQELDEWGDDEWSFDCAGCGQHGKNLDDGEHSIACERCNVWQHSKCLGFTKTAAESENFHFICNDCRQKEEEAERPKISLKFKIGQSSSPPQPSSSSHRQTDEESPVKQTSIPGNGPPRPETSDSRTDVDRHAKPAQAVLAKPSVIGDSASANAPASLLVDAQGTSSRKMPYMNGGPPMSFQLPGNGQQNIDNPHSSQSTNDHSQQSEPPSLLPQSSYGTHRPMSSHSQTPRPLSSHSLANGHSSPIRQRIPSPITNRPTMSPTQGNPEVGLIAGVPGSSPSLRPAIMATPFTNGRSGTNDRNMTLSTPQQPQSRHSSFSSSQPGVQAMSGLSPVKQPPSVSRTPLPQPTLVPQKQRQPDGSFTTPSSSFNHENRMRSVSGTPIFPPAEKLAPSPHQLNREPVPTPSKQSLPVPHGDSESSFTVLEPQLPAQIQPQAKNVQ